ncbi:MAG: hypothetical protein AMXMBFR75_23950 [Candidatus Hinthialibacteria bacterium]|nr:nodulation efficiency protein D [Candidatus Omnitrophota bacterium]
MSAIAIGGLIGIGFLLAIIEIFLPGGIFGLIGTVMILSGIIGAAITYGGSVALPLGFGCLVAAIVLFAFWINIFPTSWIGRKINLQAEVTRADGYISQPKGLEDLVGKTGVAATDLRPAGVALIDQKRVDVVTEGMFVDKGSSIIVASVDSNRVVVRSTA